MKNPAVVEVWLVVDSDGEYGVGKGEKEASEDYDEKIGGTLETIQGFRTIKVTLSVPVPEITSLVGSVPEVGKPNELKVE